MFNICHVIRQWHKVIGKIFQQESKKVNQPHFIGYISILCKRMTASHFIEYMLFKRITTSSIWNI